MNQENQTWCIQKTACEQENFHRKIWPYNNARTALLWCLRACNIRQNERVILPAYIGWSNREGSGVFDPIRELGLQYEFYAVDRYLQVDVDDLAKKLGDGTRVLVVIHYFGRPDPHLSEIVQMAHRAGIYVIEDAAHALYSAWVGNCCGQFGDATIFSLHKMLPIVNGGFLQVNNSELTKFLNAAGGYFESNSRYLMAGTEYDLAAIASARQENHAFLKDIIIQFSDKIELLWPDEADQQVIPQTLPIVIKCRPREDLYFTLNKAGFGVVSLYHTMISEISQENFPESHWLARRILNLPVHQDCTKASLQAMVDCMKGIV
ncbi:UDP-4-amino-4-deoxy-L-arabinose--oxoglutarate aminotransferase [Sporomusa ovata DSM 2662]|uniref:Perosamine synthase n=1 Tax=Sporomusa ovata TaxID=2378 RepID=A0A0U1L6G3_9FIRM|nr:DegT/DnrJ/EryC1/StrS family aminotransferase [Sporomusa ovata]EQB28399.1 DegT/DnrJ/EryC1/StrS aminotransferase [Sporomusa ovata DSM 2662]CQR74723.1 Perosamine synthase [Sporomusa ovata]